MEPLFVEPLEDLDKESVVSSNSEQEDVDSKVQQSVTLLKGAIFKLKQKMFYDLVSNDESHKASDLGAMMSFHALFLQCIGYWIGLLDHQPVPMPDLKTLELNSSFSEITKQVQTLKGVSSDSKILTYTLLFQFSSQHPFDLGKKPISE